MVRVFFVVNVSRPEIAIAYRRRNFTYYTVKLYFIRLLNSFYTKRKYKIVYFIYPHPSPLRRRGSKDLNI